MIDSLSALGWHVWITLADSVLVLVLPTVFFAGLALILKRGEALAAARRAAHEIRLNLSFYFLDVLFVVPVLGLITIAVGAVTAGVGLVLVPPGWWLAIGTYPTLFMAVFLGDFIGYWRHRIEHTRWLWPTHAIHHSDEEMGFLTL
ncbi:MAG TPA: sterol desaturase family protein, partial [Devosia sp.]|nr:sterol desaturase family protein [Devosia sp.]